jgi:acetylornithine/N-succinyldiaminopimelate aminotransferase
VLLHRENSLAFKSLIVTQVSKRPQNTLCGLFFVLKKKDRDEMNSNSIMYTTDRPDVVFTAGDGSWLQDNHGGRYLDFVQGWAVNCLGHSPEPLRLALSRQAQQLWNSSPSFYNNAQLALADSLTQASGLEKAFFVSTGAEANEGAIKLARKWGQVYKAGAYKIITMQGGFHGRTLATMSATGKASFDALFNPKVEGFIKVPFNNLDACANALDEHVAAIMLEPIQGEAGVIPATAQFIKGIAALCEEKNVLFVLDEVQTGVGRTGQLFASQHYQVTPDIMTLGKGLGGGVPLGAVLAKRSVCCFEPGDQGSTFSGNALMTAVGQAVFDVVSQSAFLSDVRKNGRYLCDALESLVGKGKVRGVGLLQAVELPGVDANVVVNACFSKGLIINAPNASCLRFMPALNVTRDEIDQMIEILSSCVDFPT